MCASVRRLWRMCRSWHWSSRAVAPPLAAHPRHKHPLAEVKKKTAFFIYYSGFVFLVILSDAFVSSSAWNSFILFLSGCNIFLSIFDYFFFSFGFFCLENFFTLLVFETDFFLLTAPAPAAAPAPAMPPAVVAAKQLATKTAEGKKRITPVFLGAYV